MVIFQIDNVFIRANGRLGKNDKTRKHTHRRETTQARSRPVLAGSVGASKVKYVEQSAH